MRATIDRRYVRDLWEFRRRRDRPSLRRRVVPGVRGLNVEMDGGRGARVDFLDGSAQRALRRTILNRVACSVTRIGVTGITSRINHGDPTTGLGCDSGRTENRGGRQPGKEPCDR